jgi:hypothetical protein
LIWFVESVSRRFNAYWYWLALRISSVFEKQPNRRGELMVVVPLSQPEIEMNHVSQASSDEESSWAMFAAAGSLVAGGLLLLTGNRKAGTVAATAGATLLLLDQQDLLRKWWNAIPRHIENVQNVLGKVQASVDEVSAQRDKLHRIFNR